MSIFMQLGPVGLKMSYEEFSDIVEKETVRVELDLSFVDVGVDEDTVLSVIEKRGFKVVLDAVSTVCNKESYCSFINLLTTKGYSRAVSILKAAMSPMTTSAEKGLNVQSAAEAAKAKGEMSLGEKFWVDLWGNNPAVELKDFIPKLYEFIRGKNRFPTEYHEDKRNRNYDEASEVKVSKNPSEDEQDEQHYPPFHHTDSSATQKDPDSKLYDCLQFMLANFSNNTITTTTASTSSAPSQPAIAKDIIQKNGWIRFCNLISQPTHDFLDKFNDFVENCGEYFHGVVNAEDVILNQKDIGSFIVRVSAREPEGAFVVCSIKRGGKSVERILVKRNNEGKLIVPLEENRRVECSTLGDVIKLMKKEERLGKPVPGPLITYKQH